MFNSKTRIALITCGAAVAILAGLYESQAADVCCGPARAVVTYARPYAAGRVAWSPSYGVSSTCNPWVPGSCGYAVYRPVRTVAYAPVTTTAYSPAASCTTILRTRQVPGQPIRNLFRVLLPPYRPIAETVCSTPQTTYYPSVSTTCYSYSGVCDPCDPCGGTASIGLSSSALGACCGAITTTPTYNGGPSTTPPNGGTPRTYRQGSPLESEQRLRPEPDANTNPATYGVPQLIDPDSRTAMRPLQQTVHYQPVSLTGSPAPSQPAADVGGWRASRD